MIPYLILFSVVALLLLISIKIKSHFFYYLCFIVLTLFSGFRFNVGSDYHSYVQLFDKIRSGGYDENFTAFTNWFCHLLINIGGTNQLIFMMYSIIILSGVCYFIKKMSVSKEISAYIFFTISIFYSVALSGIRQWAAISMMLVAIVKLAEKKYLQMVIFIIFAMQFHKTAFLLIILPILAKRFSSLIIIIVAVLSIAVLPITKPILFHFLADTRYVIYLNNLFLPKQGNLILFGAYIISLVLVVFFSGYLNNKVILNRNEIILVNMCMLSIFTIFAGEVMGINFLSFIRVNMYFQPQLIVLIPWIIKKIRPKQYINTVFILFIFICTLDFFRTFLIDGSSHQLVPYTLNLRLFN